MVIKRGYKYLAIDPGKTSGYAFANTEGIVTDFGQIEDLFEFLESIDPKPHIIVVEDFILNPHAKLGGQIVVASEGIGRVDYYCRLNKVPMVRQKNTCKPSGYAWANIRPDKNHSQSHWKDAVAHLTYYLVKQKVITFKV